MADMLSIEIHEEKVYIDDEFIELDNLESKINEIPNPLTKLSILPRYYDVQLNDVKSYFIFYERVINKVLCLFINNQIIIKRLEVPYLNNDMINFLDYLCVESLVLLDFTIGQYDDAKFYNFLEKGSIKNIYYECNNDNNDNNRIINNISIKFPNIIWGCYFRGSKLESQFRNNVKELNILNYIISYNGFQYNVRIKLGDMTNIKNDMLVFKALTKNSTGTISEWFVNNKKMYEILWNTYELKDFLVYYDTTKVFNLVCNEVVCYINKKYPQSGLTQANVICSQTEWNNVKSMY